ncbi:carbohydrate binding-domain-containing protein [Mycena galopus ATCC 62051]|nr:carbohydrate binding-domain-containing protein [Mycena galopus ATCC 62051]
MARFISPVLTAPTAGAIAVQGLQTCGSAEYDPSQYTCFNSSLLCPIVSGVKYQACGEDCYSTAEYTCFNGDFLCPYTSGGIATQACGDACYSPYEYSCNNGQLTAVPSCIGDFGYNELSQRDEPIPLSLSAIDSALGLFSNYILA